MRSAVEMFSWSMAVKWTSDTWLIRGKYINILYLAISPPISACEKAKWCKKGVSAVATMSSSFYFGQSLPLWPKISSIAFWLVRLLKISDFNGSTLPPQAAFEAPQNGISHCRKGIWPLWIFRMLTASSFQAHSDAKPHCWADPEPSEMIFFGLDAFSNSSH